jgi:hypothetical protein
MMSDVKWPPLKHSWSSYNIFYGYIMSKFVILAHVIQCSLLKGPTCHYYNSWFFLLGFLVLKKPKSDRCKKNNPINLDMSNVIG